MADIDVKGLADIKAEIRAAFDGDDVARKNRALRWATDALESLSADRDWLEARVERLEGHIAHNEEASITYGRQITEENDRLRKDNVRLRASLEEIVEITDRDHVAWYRAREALSATEDLDGYVLVSASRLIACRDALIRENVDEAFHHLRMAADPEPEVGRDHWAKWERTPDAAQKGDG